MRYTSKSEFFEIELDGFRLHFTITTFGHRLGVWIYRRWLWEFDFKKVGWCFYQKVCFGFGCIGIEYINGARTTYRETPRSYAVYRDMRFWRIFFRKGVKQ